MTAGIQVIGDHGSVQIDENYYSMVLMTSGTLSTSLQNVEAPDTTGYAPQAYLATVTYTGTSPVVCIDTKNQPIAFFYTLRNGNQFTFTFLSFNTSGSGAAATFTYYIYDTMPNISASNQGLTVYNASGNVVFSSDYEPLRIINFAQLPNSWTIQQPSGTGQSPTYYPPASTTLYSGSSTQKLAVGIACTKVYSIVASQNNVEKYLQTFCTNNGASTPYATTEGGSGAANGDGATQTPYGSYGPSESSVYQSNGGWMFIVDVTNHYI